MTHPGLNRLLDLIRVNPQDSLLVDRFLILAADLEQAARVDATLGLSEALLRKNPRRAIELAHMVYKVKPGEAQPIELMVEGLENLGRYGKATVLRAELEKVRKARETNHGLTKEATDTSIMTIEKELKFLAAIEPQNQQEVKNAPVGQSAPKTESNLHGGPQLELTEPTVLISEMGLPFDFGSVQMDPAPGSQPGVQRTSIASSESGTPNSPLQDPIPEVRATQHSHPGVSSLRPNIQIAPGVPVFRELVEPVEDYADENSVQHDEPTIFTASRKLKREKARVSLEGDPIRSDGQCVDEVRALISMQEWDKAWHVIAGQWPKANNVAAIQMFKELNLARLDFRFMGWWFDALVFDRRPRFALALSIKLLREQPHLAFAKMLMIRIPGILSLLGFAPVHWSESEGVPGLIHKLDVAKLQTPASTCIFGPRRAS